MATIGVYQLLSNSYLYEHICLENINKLYKYAGKYEYQQQYKAILEAAMDSSPEEFADKIPISPDKFDSAKNPSARI